MLPPFPGQHTLRSCSHANEKPGAEQRRRLICFMHTLDLETCREEIRTSRGAEPACEKLGNQETWSEKKENPALAAEWGGGGGSVRLATSYTGTEAAADSCHFEFSSALAAGGESSRGKTGEGRKQAPGPPPEDCFYFSTGTAVGTPCEEKQPPTPEIHQISSQPLAKRARSSLVFTSQVSRPG